MNTTEFERDADETLERIAQALEASGADCEFELKADGVLELEFADGSRIVINRHSAAREIWVAARSGGYHFRKQAERWVSTRDGAELFVVLSRLVSEQSGSAVKLGG